MLSKRTRKYIARTTLDRRFGARVKAAPLESKKIDKIKMNLMKQECFDLAWAEKQVSTLAFTCI